MISTRYRRILGALVLALAPSLASAQALQQPNLVASPGVTVDPVPGAVGKLYANDVFLQALINTRFGALGPAATLPIGTVTGTLADGGALAAETARAQAAESFLAPRLRLIGAAGLAVGGGDLSADRTITVPKASVADVAAGTDDAKALTALSVAAAFAGRQPLSSNLTAMSSGTLPPVLFASGVTQLPACTPDSTVAPVPAGQPFACGGLILIAQ